MTKFKPRIKICVSGAAAGESLKISKKLAEAVGRSVARSGAILTTGATTGLPACAAQGAKKAGGTVFGFSPASTKGEHARKYRLPLSNMDAVIFTGSGYAGRNLILTRSSDAVIILGGRIGTLNEFTIAFEDRKVIGILEGSGGITQELRDILDIAKKGKKHVLFDSDPDRLVKRVIKEVAVTDRHYHDKQRQRED
ncbi:MAG: LOG family protein [Patescibacteria group bacterium]|nr:LOG family protein [Patescibacteria group bacterium]